MVWVTDLIGYVAAVIGTFLLLPQILKTLQTKHVDDLSGLMLTAYLVQCALWGVYGYLIHSMPVLICNVLAFLMGALQTWLLFIYRKHR